MPKTATAHCCKIERPRIVGPCHMALQPVTCHSACPLRAGAVSAKLQCCGSPRSTCPSVGGIVQCCTAGGTPTGTIYVHARRKQLYTGTCVAPAVQILRVTCTHATPVQSIRCMHEHACFWANAHSTAQQPGYARLALCSAPRHTCS
jgi:hypothetical protein